MRRIEAMAVQSGEGPVRSAVLELGDVTVLTGANDSGKTRLMSHVEQALSMPEKFDGYVEVFGLAPASEIAELLDPDVPDALGLTRDADLVDEYREVLQADCRDGVVPVGVMTSGQRRLPAWRWGLSLDKLDGELAKRVEEVLGDEQGGRDPVRPTTLDYLGGADPLILPEPIVVPGRASLLQRQVGTAVTGLCRMLRAIESGWSMLGEEPGELDGDFDENWTAFEPVEPYDEDGALSWAWLIVEEQNASEAHPAALYACRAMEAIAGALLPEFVTEEYRLEISLAQPTAIARGQRVRIELLRRDTLFPEYFAEGDPDDGGLRFQLDDAASGYSLWIQLALREAIARVRMFTHILRDAALRLQLIHSAASAQEATELPFVVDGVAELKDAIEDTLRRLLDPRLAVPDPNLLALDPGEEDEDPLPLHGEETSSRPRSRLYLIDEPEQRLHPALQRRAARWLSTLMGEWGCQCMLSTHAVAFIDIPGDVRAYQLTRTAGDQAMIAPLNPHAITPQSLVSGEVGLDRGELLPRWRAFLFAETTVTAVLNELCGEELQRRRVRLIPFAEANLAKLPELTLLSELTTAPLVVVLNGSSAEEIDRLRGATAEERRRAAQESAAAATVARVIELMHSQDREIQIVSLDTAHFPGGEEGPAARNAGESSTVAAQLDGLLWQLDQAMLVDESRFRSQG